MWASLSEAEIASVAGRDPVVVLPLAATEQHGPHLPISTDVDIGEGLLRVAFAHLSESVEAWVLPTVIVGASAEHLSFERTQSVSSEELAHSIYDIGTRLAKVGVRRLVLSNSHGGNRHAMEVSGIDLRRDHAMLVVKASYFRFDRPEVALPEEEWRHGLHGGAIETAMMMYLKPDGVRPDDVANFPSLGAELEDVLDRVGPEGQASFAWLAEDLSPWGVVGDARLATAGLGSDLVQHYGRALAEVIADTRRFPLERLRTDVKAQ